MDNHYEEINDLIACDSGYDDTKKLTLNRITKKSLSFKKLHIDKKVLHLKDNIEDNPLPNK